MHRLSSLADQPGGLRKQQRVLSQALDKARRNRLQAAATPEGWTCIQNCSGLWAAVWLTVPPTEHGLSLLDGEYSALVRFRLRAPLWPGGGPCRRTRGWYDPKGDHAQSCSRNSGTWTRRHQHLRDQIRRQLRWLGFWAETEQANSRLQHRPAICIVGLTLPTTYLEVHVSHPLTRGTASAHLARGSSVSAFVEEAWRRRLSLDYGGGPPGPSFSAGPRGVLRRDEKWRGASIDSLRSTGPAHRLLAADRAALRWPVLRRPTQLNRAVPPSAHTPRPTKNRGRLRPPLGRWGAPFGWPTKRPPNTPGPFRGWACA